MIEVLNIEPINKGSIVAKCSVRIVPWKLTFHEVTIFQKGANLWVNMPTKQEQRDDGLKNYIELISFDNDAIKRRFRDQVMEAVKEYLEKNPEMKMEDVIKYNDEMPF